MCDERVEEIKGICVYISKMRLQMLLLIVLAGAWCTGSTASCGGCVRVRCGECVCTTHPHGCVTANCTGTNTTEVPAEVPNNTCVLIMRETSMDSIPDFSFQRLTNLTSLDLSVNAIQNISEYAFTGLSSLWCLNLSYNNLTFDDNLVQRGAFSPLENLRRLELKGNTYESYPEEHLSELRSLENLTLDGLNSTLGPGFSNLTNLSSLDLSSGRCRIVPLVKDMFVHVDNLRYLNISHCLVSEVDKDALSPLRQLEVLDVSFNKCLLFNGFSNLTYGLNNTNLRQLFMTKIVPSNALCVRITKDHVENLENTKLEFLEASDNRIEVLTVPALEALPKTLTTIIARNNRFTQGNYSKQLHVLENLTFMDVSGDRVAETLFQFMSDSPEFISESSWHGPGRDRCKLNDPREKLLSPSNTHRGGLYRENRKSNRTLVHVPPKLQNITYSFSELNYKLADIYLADNSLRHIDLSFNVLTEWPGPVFGVENVTYLDLSNNFAHRLKLTFFKNFKSLQKLNLSNNFLSIDIYHDEEGQMFRHQSHLEVLDLSQNNLLLLPYHFIEGLPELRELIITNNIINSLELNFTSNTNLKFINMSDNNIAFLTRALRNTLDNLAEANNLSMDLSWNPFQCTCDPEHIDFLCWLFNNRKVRFENMERYMCVVYDNNRPRFQKAYTVFKRLQKKCKVYIALAMSLLSVTVLFTTIVICGIVYRYRWRLIYLYYMGKKRWKTKQNYEQIYDYDAFVSYADDNLESVRPLMVSRLEKEQGLKLYIRHRDSTPGDSIAEGIIDAIQRSRKSVVLVSQATLAKKWCRYELQMANVQGITVKKNLLIIVLLETVPINQFPREILYYLKTKTPLQYPGRDSDQTTVFWESLAEEIRS